MFKKILIPVDVDDEHTWSKAAGVAAHLAKSSGAEIHVLSVLPDFGLSIVGSYFPKGYEEKAAQEAGKQLTKFVNEHFEEGLNVRPHVVHGKIYEQIMAAADKLGCDAIIMASHSPQLKDYLLGPNAARVVRHARQSVFVVRDEG
ncbi:universal stress protein [Salaquimonas pukyongi]|uniref:universal stress protein n=1 Tax=Salaquimonas pukyongi TaxID=2712698 RepID=UPI00096B954D|nr:universal stress protein [Salaquimonas pukyongi]